MTAIAPYQAGERKIFQTGVSTVGRGGDDFICGHCGRKMIHNMDLGRLEIEIIYECGGCGGFNLPPENK